MIRQYITDKNGKYEREIMQAESVHASTTLMADETKAIRDFLGIGVAITGSSCYLLSQLDAQKRKQILNSVYSKDGLHLGLARISVGASDYSAELYSYDDGEEDLTLSRFSIEKDEKYVIPIIKEIMQINPSIRFFASPWSPPGWMKTGGKLCGGHMRAKYVDCYADYIIKFILAYQQHGIPIYALTPQNECETQQDGRMTACVWNPDLEAEFVLTLRKKLDANGLDVKIWLHDHNFCYFDRVLWMLENYPQLPDSLDGVGFHYYGGQIEQTKIIKEKYPSLNLHFTEGGPRLYDNYSTDWSKWTIMLAKCVACGYKSFTGWNLVLDENGAPNIGPFGCGGLLTVHSITGEIEKSGQFTAMSHIAPFLTPSSVLCPILPTDFYPDNMYEYPIVSRPVTGILICNEKEKIAVLVNPNAEKKQTQLVIDGKNYYVEMIPDSVCSIVFDN